MTDHFPLQMATIFRRGKDDYALFARSETKDYVLLGVNGTYGQWDSGTLQDLQREVESPGTGFEILLGQTISSISKGYTMPHPWMVLKDAPVEVPKGPHAMAIGQYFKEFRDGEITLTELEAKVLERVK